VLKIEIAILVITYIIVPVNLHWPPKVRQSAPMHPTKIKHKNKITLSVIAHSIVPINLHLCRRFAFTDRVI